MVGRLHDAEGCMTRRTVEFVQEGKYAAEVPVDLIEDETGWSPYLSMEDARKLDAVRKALRDGDIATASKMARVFELLPASA
jgi:hypothetical protein